MQRPLLWHFLYRLGVLSTMLQAVQSLYSDSHLAFAVSGGIGQSQSLAALASLSSLLKALSKAPAQIQS